MIMKLIFTMKNTIIGVVSISFSEASNVLKNFYFLGGNCNYYSDLQCPKTNKCIRRYWICVYDQCGDGSDQIHCNGKGTTILSII